MDYSPPAIFLSMGSFNIYYYGLILVLAISLSSILSRKRLLKENLLSEIDKKEWRKEIEYIKD